MEILSIVGAGGVVGLLFGLGLLLWVEPSTFYGHAIILLVCMGLGLVFSGFIEIVKRWIWPKSSRKDAE